MIDYLSNGDLADFTEALVSGAPKRLASVYPDYPGRSPLLHLWLNR